MSDLAYYGDEMPVLAGGFLGGMTDKDIAKIIGGLGENIEPVDKDLDEKGYDTDEIEHRKEEKKHKHKNKVLILDNLSSSDSSSNEELEDDDELIIDKPSDPVKELEKRMQRITGGGNVLQTLIALIPTIFPKSYM